MAPRPSAEGLASPGIGVWAAGAALLGVCYFFWAQPKRTAKQQQLTQFSSFLKAPVAAKHGAARPTSFVAFLKETDVKDTSEDSGHEDAKAKLPGDDDIVVPILVGTEFGFCREIADKLAAELQAAEQGYWPLVLDMAEPSRVQAILERQQVLLVVCSTQGEGVPPSEARACCEWLQSSSAPALHIPFSVLAAGDRTYVHFCACGKALDARLEALGGQRFHPRTDLNREDWKAVDSWILGVVAGLSQLDLEPVSSLGGPEAIIGKSPGSEEAERWSRARPYQGTIVAINSLCQLSSADDKDTVRVEIDLGDSGLSYEPGDALGVYARNSAQAVDALLEVADLSGSTKVSVPKWQHSHAAGSSLRLQEALQLCYDIRTPRPQLLELLLRLLMAQLEGGTGSGTNTMPHIADTAGLADGSAHSSSESSIESEPAASVSGGDQAGQNDKGASAGKQPVQDADTTAQASEDSAQLANGHASANEHKDLKDEQSLSSQDPSSDDHSGSCTLQQAVQQLQALVADSAAAEAYFEPRHVLDLVQTFWRPWRVGQSLPVPEFLATLRPLIPRLYSISSSPLENPQRVQITVAAVRYKSLDLQREGVASNFLASGLKVGDAVPVYMFQNPDFRLPSNPSTPLIMVGPGTGLAPFRSFVLQRLLQSATPQPAPSSSEPDGAQTAAPRDLLFFGCRRRDQDFLYGDQLQAWHEEGVLELHTAFSREQGHKVYVQDRIKQAKDRIWELLNQGAHMYICGDAAHMAGSVEQTLLEILTEKDPTTPAQEALEQMAAERRYQKDVWY